MTRFGDVLKRTRESKGLDFDRTARELRIRPDILQAIEDSNFDVMPSRGYSRNMINAYAQFLGLNPSEIVSMYLDEAQAHRISSQRYSSGARRPINLGGKTRLERSRTTRQERAFERDSQKAWDGRPTSGRQNAFGRRLYDDRTEFARKTYGVDADDHDSDGYFEENHSYRHGGVSTSALESRHSRESFNRSYTRQASLGRSYTSTRKPSLSDWFQSNLPLVVGGAIILIILILVLSFLFVHKDNDTQDVSALPISGISDTTQTEGEPETPVIKEVAPTSMKVTYSVPKAGEDCYVEIFTNGEMTEGTTLTGPFEKEVDVTGKWTITTWRAEVLDIEIDGKKVEMQTSDEYGGMYAYTADFSKYLDQWKADHPEAVAKTTNNDASDTTTESSTSSSDSSTSTTAA